jgi:hypothetical protein
MKVAQYSPLLVGLAADIPLLFTFSTETAGAFGEKYD